MAEGQQDPPFVADEGQLNSAIQDFCLATNTQFVKSSGWKTEPSGNQLILWNSTRGSLQIPFFGRPFVVLRHGSLECHHGPNRHRRNEQVGRGEHSYNKSSRLHLQASKKLDCPAKVLVKHVRVYLDENFKTDSSSRGRRDYLSKKLRQFLLNGASVATEERIYIRFPEAGEHVGHDFDEGEEVLLAVDERIVNKVRELCHLGLTKVNDVRVVLNPFIGELFAGKKMPSSHDRRFFPKHKDLYNIIYSVRRDALSSKNDQDNVQLKVQDLQKQPHHHHVFYRPYVEEKHLPSCAEDDDVCLTGKGKGLLFVYMNGDQTELLKRYRNGLFLLDATYRTMKYPFPLFQLVVKTNVDYQVVAVFITQYEDAESIAEALQVIKDWNRAALSGVKLSFMIDNCQAEVNALQSVFKDAGIFWCNFHREQAWLRWIGGKNIHRHSLNDQGQGNLLTALRRIANADTVEQLEASVQNLKSSEEYNVPVVKSWLESTWLCELRKWVALYRQDCLAISVTTTNGVESKHRNLKYDYLSKYSGRSLSGVIEAIVEHYLPDMYNRYKSENLMARSSVKRYSSSVPVFLHNRPKPFIEHCMNRLKSTHEVVILPTPNGSVYTVQGGTAEYLVDMAKPECSCFDFRKFRLPCKHILAICVGNPQAWNSFSSEYLQSPFHTLDFCSSSVREEDSSVSAETTQSSPSQPEVTQTSSSPTEAMLHDLEEAEPDQLGQKTTDRTEVRHFVKNQLKDIMAMVDIINDRKSLEMARSQLHQLQMALSKSNIALKGATRLPLHITSRKNSTKTAGKRVARRKARAQVLPSLRVSRKRKPGRRAVGLESGVSINYLNEEMPSLSHCFDNPVHIQDTGSEARQIEDPLQLQCGVCQKTFRTRLLLIRHVKSVHEAGQTPVAGNGGTRQASVSSDIQEKPQECEVLTMDEILKVKASSGSYACKFCAKCFRKRSFLMLHISRNHGKVEQLASKRKAEESNIQRLQHMAKRQCRDNDGPATEQGGDTVEPPVSGLSNLGNTCFLAAIIQCYRQTSVLVEGLQTVHQKKSCNCFVCNFRGVLGGDDISEDLLISMQDVWKDYVEGEQHCALECFSKVNSAIDIVTRKQQYGDGLAEQCFGSFLEIQNACTHCEWSSRSSFETVTEISLPVMRNKTLMETLHHDVYCGDLEDYKCRNPKCGSMDVKRTWKLAKPANVIVVSLKRNNNKGHKTSDRVDIDEWIDIPTSDTPVRYAVYGVVVHCGSTSTSGHYYSYVKYQGHWWKLDDKIVRPVEWKEVRQSCWSILFMCPQCPCGNVHGDIGNLHKCLSSHDLEKGNDELKHRKIKIQRKKIIPVSYDEDFLRRNESVRDVTAEELANHYKTLMTTKPEEEESCDYGLSVNDIQYSEEFLTEKISAVLEGIDELFECEGDCSNDFHERHHQYRKGRKVTIEPELFGNFGLGTQNLTTYLLRKKFFTWTRSNRVYSNPIPMKKSSLPEFATRRSLTGDDYLDKVLVFYVLDHLSEDLRESD